VPNEVVSVTLRLLSGRTCVARVASDALVIDLKLAVECKFGVPIEQMRLVFQGRQLQEQTALAAAAGEDHIEYFGDGSMGCVYVVLRASSLSTRLNSAADGCVPHPSAPPKFICAIGRGIVTDPVRAADGHIYQRRTIERLIEQRGDRSPQSNGPLLPLWHDVATQAAAAAWLSAHPPPEQHEQRPPDDAAVERELEVVVPGDLANGAVTSVCVIVTLLDDADHVAATLQASLRSVYPGWPVAQTTGRLAFKNTQLEPGIPLWRYGIDTTIMLTAF
jgi:hypothetical protein